MIVYSNSDSFGVISNGKVYADFVSEHFGAKLIQRDQPGCCNSRIFRTTIRDLLELKTTEKVLVLIGTTNVYRTEYWSETPTNNDGHFRSIRLTETRNDKHSKEYANYAREYSLLHSEEAEVTNLYCDLVMLTSFLKEKGYSYLIWNGTNTFKPIDFSAPFVSAFANQLSADNNVIPIDKFSFCEYSLSKGHVPIDYKVYGNYGHHGEAAHRDFAQYIIENHLNEI
jgi:hypothetical protein